jgi:hypothetical protein
MIQTKNRVSKTVIDIALLYQSCFAQILEDLPIILLQSAIFWISFNISIGSIILFPLNFQQSLGVVLLIKVVSKLVLRP